VEYRRFPRSRTNRGHRPPIEISESCVRVATANTDDDATTIYDLASRCESVERYRHEKVRSR